MPIPQDWIANARAFRRELALLQAVHLFCGVLTIEKFLTIPYLLTNAGCLTDCCNSWVYSSSS
jgi:hypothetical protein